MKSSLLTSFVAISLAASSAFSNTIPSSQKLAVAPAFKRLLPSLPVPAPGSYYTLPVTQLADRKRDETAGGNDNSGNNNVGGNDGGRSGNNGEGEGNGGKNNGAGDKGNNGGPGGNDGNNKKGGFINGNNNMNDFDIKFDGANNSDRNNEYIRRDIRFLNLALLLEEFLVSFFERGLLRYSQVDFISAGYPQWVRGRYEQICEHEKKHREYIQSAITSAGGDYVRSCRYEFTDDNVRSFVETSEALETIAASAYTGSLQYFHDRSYITAGASILAVEARHAAWINGAVRKQNPTNTAFETPLTPSEVATLLTTFFDFNSCPAGNANNLPNGLRVFPRLNLSPRLVPGQQAEISFYNQIENNNNEHLYAAFLTGIETIFVPIEEREGDNKEGNNGGNNNGDKGSNNHKRYFVNIPQDTQASGTVFVTIVRGSEKIGDVSLNDDSIVAGPAIAEFPFDSNDKPIKW